MINEKHAIQFQIVAIQVYQQCILQQDGRQRSQMSQCPTDHQSHQLCVCHMESKLQMLDDY